MRGKNPDMLSSQKSLNFFFRLFLTGYPQNHKMDIHVLFILFTPFFHSSDIFQRFFRISGMQARYLCGNCLFLNFPHYPQSYPQKRGSKCLLFRHFCFSLWITFQKSEVIHSIFAKSACFLSTAESRFPISKSCHIYNKSVIKM